MQTPGINIQEITFTSGSHKLELEHDQIHSMYLMDGDMLLENRTLNPDDFIVVDEHNTLNFSSETGGKIFVISSLSEVPYETYVASR